MKTNNRKRLIKIMAIIFSGIIIEVIFIFQKIEAKHNTDPNTSIIKNASV